MKKRKKTKNPGKQILVRKKKKSEKGKLIHENH